jgi:hypothetical protein
MVLEIRAKTRKSVDVSNRRRGDRPSHIFRASLSGQRYEDFLSMLSMGLHTVVEAARCY